MKRSVTGGIAALTALCYAVAAKAQEAAPAAPTLDKGDTAWMLISTALVLMMLIPGLALFYGGLVRKENVLTTVMQSFITCCVVSITWLVLGYSLAFTSGTPFLGGFDRLLLRGMDMKALSGTIPESLFVMFQLTFAAITTALILGAVADRIKFSATVVFAAIWSIVVYAPVAHWVWGPAGFIGGTGVTGFQGIGGFGGMLDFAGGAVVHVNAGIAGLMAAIVLGKRHHHAADVHYPHNIVLSVIGASLLWVGWFGFNAGSAVASGERAGMAMLVTHAATAAAAIAWMIADWSTKGKPTVIGTITGAVAGLVAITPASGFVGLDGALIIGLSAGFVCFWASIVLKEKFKIPDSLDVFSVHGVGGILGAILTGVFAKASIGGTAGVLEGNMNQLFAQLIGTAVVIVYSGVASYVILKVLNLVIGLRVDETAERDSLDLALHGEKVL